MLHNQLKIKYPECPFLTHDVNPTTIIKQLRFDEDVIDPIKFIEIIMDKTTHQNSDLSKLNSDSVINFLSHYLQPNDFIDEIKWSKLEQSIRDFDFKRNMYVNFHSAAYRDEYGPIINKEFEGDIGWVIIPIEPIDLIVVNSSVNYTIHSVISSRSVIEKSVKTPIQPNYVQTNYDKFESNIRSNRTSIRKFVTRNDIEIKEKKDITLDTEDPINTNTNKLMQYRIKIGRIPLTDKTRASAGMIRERLADPSRMYRFRNNPELLKQIKKIDPHIRELSDTITEKHNANYRSIERDVSRNNFDFVLEKVGIKKINGVLKFNPVNTGKITITDNHSLSTAYFVSVLRYKKNLHITLHYLS